MLMVLSPCLYYIAGTFLWLDESIYALFVFKLKNNFYYSFYKETLSSSTLKEGPVFVP